MAAITNLSDPLSDEEIELLQAILLDRVDEDAVTDGKDEGVLDVSELDGADSGCQWAGDDRALALAAGSLG
jgi:hypothetical protein